jgi:hypothetical protein
MERCGKALTTPEDLARIEVFAFLGRLAEAGQVELSSRDDGDVEARFLTGEVFLLDALNITRLN